jgi:hypothetical protein
MTRTIATTEKDSDSSASVRSRIKGVVDECRLQRYVDEAECGLGAREFSAEYCDQAPRSSRVLTCTTAASSGW